MTNRTTLNFLGLQAYTGINAQEIEHETNEEIHFITIIIKLKILF